MDPIYLALKKGNKMATQRKVSVADCSRGSSQTRDATPSSDLTVFNYRHRLNGLRELSLTRMIIYLKSRSSFGNTKSSNGSPPVSSFVLNNSNANSTSSSHLSSASCAAKLLADCSPTRQSLENKGEKRNFILVFSKFSIVTVFSVFLYP